MKWLVLRREEINKVRAIKLTGIGYFMFKFCSRPFFPEMWPTKLVLKYVIKRVSSQTSKEKKMSNYTHLPEKKYFLTHLDFSTTLIPNLIKLKANLS